jgi:hypothetical protein
MNDDAFQRLIDKQILECRWTDISARWLNFLPAIEPSGSAPDVGLSEFIGFTDVAATIAEYGVSIRTEAPGVREYVFREAVYLLHKAFHVTGCAENQAKKGYKTWSLADAYQASLFGAKAILYFCGIALAEFDNKAVLIDVFPKVEDRQKRQKLKLKLLDDPAIQFIKLNMKFEHRHVWAIFQRLLNVFDMSVWEDSYIRALKKLGGKDFAKQRNELNYKNEVWIFDDLHDLVVDPSFGSHPTTEIEKSLAYELESDFSINLSLAILRMGVLLLESVTALSNALKPELQMIKDRVTVARHPLYSVTYP